LGACTPVGPPPAPQSNAACHFYNAYEGLSLVCTDPNTASQFHPLDAGHLAELPASFVGRTYDCGLLQAAEASIAAQWSFAVSWLAPEYSLGSRNCHDYVCAVLGAYDGIGNPCSQIRPGA
jgi:hypothetical protein